LCEELVGVFSCVIPASIVFTIGHRKAEGSKPPMAGLFRKGADGIVLLFFPGHPGLDRFYPRLHNELENLFRNHVLERIYGNY
jgi:hypothetical protein